MDPFTNQPLWLLVVGDQLRIYSVGEDVRDDGGDVTGNTPKDWGAVLHIDRHRDALDEP